MSSIPNTTNLQSECVNKASILWTMLFKMWKITLKQYAKLCEITSIHKTSCYYSTETCITIG